MVRSAQPFTYRDVKVELRDHSETGAPLPVLLFWPSMLCWQKYSTPLVASILTKFGGTKSP